MKKFVPYSLIFTILATGAMFAKDKVETSSNVTIAYKDSDKFTDARSSFGFNTDQNYLDMLSDHLREIAGKKLAAGQKLEITVTDVDLAGEFLPTSHPDQVRVVKEIFRPRITLEFKLTDAAGVVVKEGKRTLTDLNFMSNLSIIGRNDPLFYDKEMLTDWVRKEFKS